MKETLERSEVKMRLCFDLSDNSSASHNSRCVLRSTQPAATLSELVRRILMEYGRGVLNTRERVLNTLDRIEIPPRPH
jgi:hypothetical protein